MEEVEKLELGDLVVVDKDLELFTGWKGKVVELCSDDYVRVCLILNAYDEPAHYIVDLPFKFLLKIASK